MTQHQVKWNAEQICHANPSPNKTFLFNVLIVCAGGGQCFHFCSQGPQERASGTGTASREDVPQNTPYLGRGKKQTMTSGWCHVTMTVIWGHNKWLWGMINCYCVRHVCFTEAVQLLHFLYPFNSSRRVHYYEVKFSFWLNMKMCLAAVLKGVDWGWWCAFGCVCVPGWWWWWGGGCLPEHSVSLGERGQVVNRGQSWGWSVNWQGCIN